ncbi:hypothetical protein [Angustibacter aerolatus]
MTVTAIAPHRTDSPAVLHDRRVLRVWTSAGRSACSWAYLEGAGWRRIGTTTPAGRQLLEACRLARTEGWSVHALVTHDDLCRLERA